MRKYNYNWESKKLTVDFNHKIWRQDIAEYVKKKLFWGATRVTRSRKNADGTKIFEIYNCYGISVRVCYRKKREIVFCDESEIINNYLAEMEK